MNMLKTSAFQIEKMPIQGEITLGRRETIRLPRNAHWINVVQGCAWVAVGQEDVILIPGDTLNLASLRPEAKILTAMGHTPLVLHYE